MIESKSVDGRTIPEAYWRRVQISPRDNLYLVKRQGQYSNITWEEVHAQVLGVFGLLRSLNVGPDDKVCISSNSRPEWTMIDLAIQSLGGVTVPIYHSSTVEDIAYILENCEAKVVFAEDEAQTRKLKEALAQIKRDIPILDIQALKSLAPPTTDSELQKAFEASIARVQPEDPASIVYTSGTTGRPKGAVLTQNNFMSECRAIVSVVNFGVTDLTVTFLPFAHIFGRVESFIPILTGLRLGFAESINSVAINITEIKPTILVSVPRIYEKIYAKIQSEVEASPDFRKNVFYWAVGIGRNVARARAEGQPVSVGQLLKYRIADRLVFSKIRAKLGGNIRLTVSGGAPLNPELCELFHACGIKVLEGYGLTETTAAVFCNRPDSYGFGTVGKPMNGVQTRIAADGEIQVKGPMVFSGYHRNEEATREVFTPDGWFCTGDIGEITPRGFLRITDRKKELIVTSGGKNIAPQKIENLLKGSRFVSNGLVYGDKQKYLVALVTLNEPEVKAWAKAQSLNGNFREKVSTLIDAEIKQINGQLASYESIKRFHILEGDFTVESGELTPSLKLKRKVLVAKYKEQIESLYH